MLSAHALNFPCSAKGYKKVANMQMTIVEWNTQLNHHRPVGSLPLANSIASSIYIIYIYLRPYVVQLRMLKNYALLFIRKNFNIFTCCPVIMSCRQCRIVYARVCSSVLSHSWISPEKMPFVIEERGKENVVPVRLLSRERLVSISVACVIENGQGNASPQKQRRKGKRD